MCLLVDVDFEWSGVISVDFACAWRGVIFARRRCRIRDTFADVAAAICLVLVAVVTSCRFVVICFLFFEVDCTLKVEWEIDSTKLIVYGHDVASTFDFFISLHVLDSMDDRMGDCLLFVQWMHRSARLFF